LSDNPPDIFQTDSAKSNETLIEEKMNQYGFVVEKDASKRIINIQESVQALAIKNLRKSLEKLEKIYKKESENHTIVLSLISRHKRIQNHLNNGIIEIEYADRIISVIFNTVIKMTKNLEEGDLR